MWLIFDVTHADQRADIARRVLTSVVLSGWDVKSNQPLPNTKPPNLASLLQFLEGATSHVLELTKTTEVRSALLG